VVVVRDRAQRLNDRHWTSRLQFKFTGNGGLIARNPCKRGGDETLAKIA
jgi:hypothetical protein